MNKILIIIYLCLISKIVFAAAAGDHCIIAGWPSEFDDKEKCIVPDVDEDLRDSTCFEKGELTCNPSFYGKEKCVPADKLEMANEYCSKERSIPVLNEEKFLDALDKLHRESKFVCSEAMGTPGLHPIICGESEQKLLEELFDFIYEGPVVGSGDEAFIKFAEQFVSFMEGRRPLQEHTGELQEEDAKDYFEDAPREFHPEEAGDEEDEEECPYNNNNQTDEAINGLLNQARQLLNKE